MVFVCSLPNCKRESKFKIPCALKFPEIHRKWLDFIGVDAIKHMSRKGLCEAHFTPDQFIDEGQRSGLKLIRRRLRKNAVPTIIDLDLDSNSKRDTKGPEKTSSDSNDSNVNGSLPVSASLRKRGRPNSLEFQDVTEEIKRICEDVAVEKPGNIDGAEEIGDGRSGTACGKPEEFQWLREVNVNEDSENEEDGDCSDEKTDAGKEFNNIYRSFEGNEQLASEIHSNPHILVLEEEVHSQETQTGLKSGNTRETQTEFKDLKNCSAQTPMALGYTVRDYRNNEDVMLYFTGLENYHKFEFVLVSLIPEALSLKYKYWQVQNVSVEDQLFITLWKLRRNTPDFELGFHFGISRSAVINILHTWIPFIAGQWRQLDLWPSRELVDYFMPECFKKNYPKTRVIIDGTEIPIQRSSNPRFQQASFSAYKHHNTLKTVVGATPGGLFSYWSSAYAGSTSDRQVIERSDLPIRCDKNDLVMADRGFNIQDILAPHDVYLKIPNFLNGKSQLEGMTLLQDRKLARHRVHIERLIGCMKTFQILSHTLCHNYVRLADDIISICLMLCNFRECIMK